MTTEISVMYDSEKVKTKFTKLFKTKMLSIVVARPHLNPYYSSIRIPPVSAQKPVVDQSRKE